MFLNDSQQLDFDSLNKIEASSSEVDWSDLPTSQPFKVPADIEELRYSNLSDRCRARCLIENYANIFLPSVKE